MIKISIIRTFRIWLIATHVMHTMYVWRFFAGAYGHKVILCFFQILKLL